MGKHDVIERPWQPGYAEQRTVASLVVAYRERPRAAGPAVALNAPARHGYRYGSWLRGGLSAALRSAERVLTAADGGVGFARRVGEELWSQVRADRRSARKASVGATVLKLRITGYFWERKEARKFQQSFEDSAPGATVEFAAVLHGIPNVRNHD